MSDLAAMREPTLESLQAQGAPAHDPVRWHYLQTLARRIPTQPPAVQQVLAGRLQAAVAAYAGHARPAVVAAEIACSKPEKLAAPALESPLALLNQAFSPPALAGAELVPNGGPASLPALKSVQQFGEVWAKVSAEQQVSQALHRAPENAGPLNSHKLMLRSLSLMRTLSPDYLRHFLAQMDALQWLERASAKSAKPSTKLPGAAAKAGRKGRAKP